MPNPIFDIYFSHSMRIGFKIRIVIFDRYNFFTSSNYAGTIMALNIFPHFQTLPVIISLSLIHI